MSNASANPIELPLIDKIAPNPDITIYFTGLMLMAYNSRGWVEVGVHSTAVNHSFKIYVKRISHTVTPLLQTVFDQSMPWASEVTIGVDDATGERIHFYQRDPFDRDNFSNLLGTDSYGALSIDDPNDFRWIIDFENRELHNKNMLVDAERLFPRLRINDGLFYTAKRTRTTFNRIDESVFNSKTYFGAVAHVIAANIYLPDCKSATLKIGDQINIPFRKTPGVTYKIAFVNDPEEEEPEHNDFKEYYSVIQEENSTRQYDLRPYDEEILVSPLPSIENPPEGNGIRQGKQYSGQEKTKTRGAIPPLPPPRGGSDKVPCASSFLGRTDGLPSRGQ